jgi:hypothetical protein
VPRLDEVAQVPLADKPVLAKRVCVVAAKTLFILL